MSNNPAQKDEWKKLEKLSKTSINPNNLFSENSKRFDEFSLELDGILFDYSKQKVTSEILENLLSLAKSSDIEEKRNAMFSGKKINTTEKRAVLHTALRSTKNDDIKIDNENITPLIQATLKRIQNLSHQIREGKYLGATGKPITKVISIGVGGSDLGSRMVHKALNDGKQPIKMRFVSNIDADDLNDTLQKCNPETTLFIVISKSFGTQETLTNAITAREWLEKQLGEHTNISNHFIAVSANIQTAEDFGIHKTNIYPMWDWVNGRFSLWSAVGIPLAIGLGFDTFSDLLRGAEKIDEHFKNEPLSRNMPVLMALINIWNRNFLDSHHQAILPYTQKLSLFPAYLQQLEMESNGKGVDLDGNKITDYKTGSVLFGEAGTNGQHSFYQLFHQGSDVVPCDFIGFIKPNHTNQKHHDLLLGNMLAQGQAMMQGRSNPDDPHHDCTKNKPSTTILLDKLDAYHLGMLIALYEHKVMVQGVIWNINNFDQFGVELGKKMARNIEENDLSSLDPSTKGLYSRIHQRKN